jgi:hypothetical protein
LEFKKVAGKDEINKGLVLLAFKIKLAQRKKRTRMENYTAGS